jgi:Protein of unknown function (DUF3054)
MTPDNLGVRLGSRPRRLLAGDLACYLVATILGFATHQELALSASERFLATWLPFSAAWLLVAPAMGVYAGGEELEWRHLARAAWASVISAPLGGVLRAVWLGGAVVPVFVLVMAGVTTGLVVAWRVAEVLLLGKAKV